MSRRATPKINAISPTVSPATPTSWTPGPRRRSLRNSLTGWVDDDDSSSTHLPDGSAPAGSRNHSHLAVLHRCAGATRRRTRCRGTTPPSRAGSSIPIARRCRSRSATLSRHAGLLDEYGSDAVRYWAANGRPGTDTAFDTNQMKVGRRLSIKLLNASKFVLSFPDSGRRRCTNRCRSTLALLDSSRQVGRRSHGGIRGFDYARALERTENFFWSFCDDYLELVKTRAYGADHSQKMPTRPGQRCASRCQPCNACWRRSCRSSPKKFGQWWQVGSIHRAEWPSLFGANAERLVGSDHVGLVRSPPSQVRRQSLAARHHLVVCSDNACSRDCVGSTCRR